MSIYKIQFKNKKGVIEDINLVGGAYAYLEGDTLIINNSGECNPIYSSDSVTVIDVSTLEPDGDDVAHLDLSKPGKYLLSNEQGNEYTYSLKINLGKTKDGAFGKFYAIIPPSDQMGFTDLDYYCGFRGDDSYIYLYHTVSLNGYAMYLEVFDNYVLVFVAGRN